MSSNSFVEVNGHPIGDGEYEVREGDCIEYIAARCGHQWNTIWDHPRNAKLKAARKSPNILLEGDRLHIPPLRLGEYARPTDQRHSFVVLGRLSRFRLRVLEGGQPRANEQYRLRIDHRHFQGTTDGDGNIDVPIPPDAVEGELIVGSTELLQRTYRLQLGGMDPIQSLSGIQKRLRNLGYNCPVTGQMDDRTAAEIAVFQNDHGLEPTGVTDDDTLGALEGAHAS